MFHILKCKPSLYSLGWLNLGLLYSTWHKDKAHKSMNRGQSSAPVPAPPPPIPPRPQGVEQRTAEGQFKRLLELAVDIGRRSRPMMSNASRDLTSSELALCMLGLLLYIYAVYHMF